MTVLRSREIVAPKTTPNSSKPRLKADSPSTPAQTHNTSPNTLQSPPDASTPSPQPQYQNPYPNFGSNPKRGCVELTSDSVAVSGGVVRRRSLRLASKCPDSAEGSDKKISAEKSGKMSSAARDDDTCAMAEETVVIGGIGGEDEDRVSNCEVGFDLFGKRGTVKADEGLSELGMNCDLGSSEANYSGEGKNKRKLEIDINFPASNCEGEDGGSEGFLSLRLRKKVAKRGVDGGSNEGLVIYLDADENGSVKSKGGLGSVDGGRNEGLVICLDADDNGGVKSKGGLGSAEKGKEKLGERTFVINDGSDIVVLDSEDELDDDHIESSSRKVSGVMEGAVENINDGVIARDNGISRGEDGFVSNDVDVVEIADEDVNPSNSSCGKRKLSDAIEGEAEGLKDDVISSGNDTDKVRRRFSSSEKGKGILVGEPVSAVGNVDTELVLSSVSNVVPSPVQIQEIVALHNEGHVTSSNTRENVALQNERVAHNSNARENVAFPNEGQVYNSNARENAPDGSRYMDRFREIARRNASRFARFNPEEDEGINVAPPVEVAQDMEDWPGPFSTAMKIIKDRAAKGAQVPSKDNSKPRVTWVPRTEARPFSKNLIPTLQDLCLSVLVKNSDAIASLEHVADCLRHRLCQMLSDSRRMNRHFFELLIQGLPTEVRIRDCSWMTDEQFTESFKLCDPSHLTVLQLDQCGRCMPDYVVHSTLARSSKCLPALITLSLRGACRLSDVGLSAILSSAPELRSLNLSQCSLLSSSSLNTLAGSLGSVLKELYLNDCQGMDAMLILPSLKRLEQLEVLSVAGVETVCDDFIREFSTACGHRLKELVLTDCGKLTDSSMKVIAETCSGLCALDLVNLHKLTDSGLGYLSNGCSAMETLKFCRNSFSDEAIAAFLETSGECLKELSLNNITKVGHNTAISLAKRSRNLHTLDLSWCRDLTDETLGLIVDSCLSLRILKLFGCTQITNVFLHGHSNPEVRIIGLKFSPVLEQVKVPDANSGPLRYSPVF